MFWMILACIRGVDPVADDTGSGDTNAQGSEPLEPADRMDPSELPTAGSPCRAPLLVEVTDVIDGDTVWVYSDAGSEKVRLIGIDAPEMSDGGECFGQEATDEVRSILQGHRAWLTFDAECEDHYGRSLAYVHVAPTEDGFLQRWLLRGGWVDTLEVAPNLSFADTFEADRQTLLRPLSLGCGTRTGLLGCWAALHFR